MLNRYFYYALIACLVLDGCSAIAKFDSATFQRTNLLKARTLIIMEHGGEPYDKYSDKIDSLLVEAQTIYTMQMIRDKNSESTNQWKALIGTNKSLLTGFFTLWKKEQKVSDTYIENKKPLVSDGFDEILKLEGAKLKN